MDGQSPDQIHFHNHDLEYSLENAEAISNWLSSVISSEKLRQGSLDFTFMSDDALLKINREHLNHDFYTDIITFEYNEEGLVSGDILISLDRIKDNAQELNNSLADELHRVLVHGVLHLCGYKDKTDSEQVEMRAKEDYYLSLRSF